MKNKNISFLDWARENNQDLITEWDNDKNTILPSEISYKSDKKVHWKVHFYDSFLKRDFVFEWETSIRNRTVLGSGCPYLSKPVKTLYKGFNDLATRFPNLVHEWNYEKNRFTPDNYLPGTASKVWWICNECKHEFEMSINSRTKSGCGCPFCARKIVKSGINDLETTHKSLLEEWDYSKNTILPNEVSYGSNKEVWWVCKKCGNSYKTSISNRTSGHGCKYCAGMVASKGVNDLATIYPQLAEEWGEKNNCKPNEFLPMSHSKVFWKCLKGHEEYKMSIKQRVVGQGCPKCAIQTQTSFPEQAIYYYIKRVFPDAINRYKFQSKYEIDIYIPSVNIGIEYNGIYYHKSEKKSQFDKQKKEYLLNFLNRYIIISEYKNEKDNLSDFYIKVNYSDKDFNNLIDNLITHISNDRINADISKDRMEIKKNYYSIVAKNSVLNDYLLCKEWDYKKNKINPEFVTLGSSDKYYWICNKCGTSFFVEPKKRKNGKGCPKCGRMSSASSTYNLAISYPQIAKEWDLSKNSESPLNIYPGGNTKYYWICEKGHSYKSTTYDRIRGAGCPICAGKIVLPGYNDLESQKPELLLDWDYKKNLIKPNSIHCGSFKEVFWKCHICGYEWKSKVNGRKQCQNCLSREKIINVYDAISLDFVGTFKSIQDACEKLLIDYKKQHGNISLCCSRKQKTVSGYIFRHDYDDELK